MASSEDDEKTLITSPPYTHAASALATGSNVLPIGTRLGEFEIIGLIGEGGFGIVYLCEDHSLGRRVALKEYMPSSLAARSDGLQVSVKSKRMLETFETGRRSFVNEARLLAQFDHPALVKVYRFWEANGTAYMVMPYYEGTTLKEALLERHERPDEAWLKRLLAPIMGALEIMHGAQVYHRDVAPDNILLLTDGRPVLLDLGAARRVIGDMTQVLTIILKPGYAPLEQYAEVPSLKQGAWTDIYALAAVVYFAILGKTPVPSVARMVKDNLVPLASEAAGRYSAAFLKGLDRGLALKPEDRPQTIAEFRRLLGVESDSTPPPIQKPATSNETSAVPRPRRRSLAIPLGAAGVVLLGVTAAYLWLGGDTAPPSPERTAPEATASQAPKAPAPEIPPVSPPVALTPLEQLDAIFEGRDRDHGVAIELEQAQVRIGKDKLRFRLRSSKPGYLYVMMVGTDREHFYLLFPNAVDRDNKVSVGRTINLPRPGWAMVAGGPPGTDHFIAVVSENPRDFSAAGLIQIDPFAEFPVARTAELAAANPRAGSPFLGQPRCSSGEAECSDRYGAALFTIEEM
jgi:serine/threonine protein kinase